MTHPYASKHYAEAFAGTYIPLSLADAKSWVLKRPIGDTGHHDATGCYPICIMDPATNLEHCFEELRRQEVVSLVLVTDLFFCPPPAVLQQSFDHCVPYKSHYLCDLTQPEQDYTAHHRYETKQAHTNCEVRVIALKEYLPQWIDLYRQLVRRHQINGIQAFSDHYFTHLSSMDYITTIAAFDQEKLLSAHIWVGYEGVVYSHLAASSEEGYAIGAAYAIYDYAIRFFREKKARVIDFGGGAGTDLASDGLSRFKKGFSNREEKNFLCGKILNEKRYRELCQKMAPSHFFPAYRKG